MARHRLTMLEVDEVSGVNKGANNKRFLILKAAEAAPTKTEAGLEGFDAGDYAYTPDKEKPSTWKLRLTKTPGGKPDAGLVGGCQATLGPGGFRGKKVDIPETDLPAVKARLRTAWLQANPDKTEADIPDVVAKDSKPSGLSWIREALRKAAGISGPTTEDNEMTAEEIKKAVGEAMDEVLVPIQKRVEVLEAAAAEEPPAATQEEAGKEAEKDDPAVTAEVVTKALQEALATALAPIQQRISVLESVAGQRQSGIPPAPGEVKKSIWAGVI